MSARILVVDDIFPNVKLLEAKLRSEYYEVITATSGEEALEKVATESPDIILLDVMMPVMDGFEVCEKIKKNPDTAHIPVVMVTALTDSHDRVRGLIAGADDFISKPVNDIALMSRVRSLVRLKMTVDEWMSRENTASHLGVNEGISNFMDESFEKASILIVEDQDFEINKLSETLKKDHDHVSIAKTGAQAVSEVLSNDFDLIVVSLNLKDEDGLRLCSHFRSNERSRAVPVLMIGEESEMPKIARGLEMGVHDYILRPIDRNEFHARCRTQIRRKRFQDRLKANYEVSLSMALTDALTGLYNRRYLEVHLHKLLQKNENTRKALCVMMLDIDHFKKVNDTYGHDVGDEVLKEYADRLVMNVRSFDLVARLGGEEFVIILPDVTEERSKIVAERIRLAIADKPFPCQVPEGHINITTSIGVAFVKGNSHTVQNVLKSSDEQLYQAKENGRNCVFFAGEGKLDPDDYLQNSRDMLHNEFDESSAPISEE